MDQFHLFLVRMVSFSTVWVYYNRTVYTWELGEQSLNMDNSKSDTVSLELNTYTE